MEAAAQAQPEVPRKRETFKEGIQRRQEESKAKLAAKQAPEEEQAVRTEERIAAGARRDVEDAKARMRIRFGAGREIRKLPEHLWESFSQAGPWATRTACWRSQATSSFPLRFDVPRAHVVPPLTMTPVVEVLDDTG